MSSLKKRTLCALVVALASVLLSCMVDTNREDADRDEDLDVATSALIAANGFTYPLASMGSWTNGNYGACGVGTYFADLCHIGNDLSASRGTSVYALAAGIVLAKSATQDAGCSSGWGKDAGFTNTCNMALAIQHYDDDGVPFVSVYGHMIYVAGFGPGTSVTPGQIIGAVAHVETGGEHLHWGIRPGTSAPTVWGRSNCPGASQPAGPNFPGSCSGGSNGFVQPGTFMSAAGRNWVVPPVAPTLVSPAHGAVVSSFTVPLQWSNGSGTYRSHIMVCTNSALTTGCINPDGGAVGIETTGTGANRSTSYNLAIGPGIYFWAVRGIAYNDYGGWGSYSAVRGFTRL